MGIWSRNPLVNSQPRETSSFLTDNLPTGPFSDLASQKKISFGFPCRSFSFLPCGILPLYSPSDQTIPFLPSPLEGSTFSYLTYPLHISNPQGTLTVDLQLSPSSPFRRHINKNHRPSPRGTRTHHKPNSHVCLIFPFTDILLDPNKQERKNSLIRFPANPFPRAARELHRRAFLRRIAVLFAVHRGWCTRKRNANSSANHFSYFFLRYHRIKNHLPFFHPLPTSSA